MSSPEVEFKLEENGLRNAVERATVLSFLLSICFVAWGAVSINIVQRFSPEISFWSNFWPRVLFNGLPLLLLGLFLKRSQISLKKKFTLWIFTLASVMQIASWIYVWPIALSKSVEILVYVNPANVYTFVLIFAFIAPPPKYVFAFTSVLSAIFVVPLFIISFMGQDKVISMIVVNDTTLSIIVGVVMSQLINRLHSKIAKMELEKEEHAKQFLGPVISKAIFEGQSELLTKKKARAFVLTLDVRDSTELLQKYGDRWLAFRREYFNAVSALVKKSGGYIQKTMGDGHIINFGVNEGVDLSDIPGIEREVAEAEEHLMQHYSRVTFRCIDDIFEKFSVLAEQHFPGENIRLGGGLDKGLVERHVQGTDGTLELDFNGSPVNCSARLQEYTKTLVHQHEANASLLAISPFASDYISKEEFLHYKKIDTQQIPVRNFSGIRWLLVKEYRPQGNRNRVAA